MNNVVPLRSASARSIIEHAAAITQLGKLAAQSFDTLILAEGPPHPDYVLLDLCASALFAIKQAEISAEECRNQRGGMSDPVYAAMRHREREWSGKASHDIREAGKLRATTPAALYAKALLISHSRSGAPVLGVSLAEDFLALDELRAALWPAGEGVTHG